jgi:predicted NAD/FAD-binding protein
MKIAVIGGGTSGMVTAWLLDERHDVTLFERDNVLGGNIRTLGGNVECILPSGVKLEAGVVEFDRFHFEKFHGLMKALGVEMAAVPITTGLFLADGSNWHAPDRLVHEFPNTQQQLFQKLRHMPLALSRRRFLSRIEAVSVDRTREATLDDFLDDDVFGKWIKMLLMYAYSIPYERAGQIGASLAIPTLHRFLVWSDWTRVVGGVWTYVERILEQLQAHVIVGAVVEAAQRTDSAVQITVAGRGTTHFDAVVFAVTPEQVLPILTDPTDDERRRFGAWRANTARTVVHRDTGLYDRRGIRYYSEFDVFETSSGAHGYNAYLNRLCGVSVDSATHYSLAFGLDDEIDPACVIHEQEHVTPLYDVEALRWRDEIVATNGENRTWYAGAWLGDGLQEGAVVSAERVSIGLGGRTIDI